MVPYRVGCRAVVRRQVLGAFPCRHHVEAADARPFHHLAGEGGLIAVGHGVDDARVARFGRQQWSREHVGLDVHHHDVLAGGEGGAGVGDAGGGIARRLHHHVDAAVPNRVERIVGEAGAGGESVAPTDAAACGAGAVRVEIRDHAHLEPGRRGRLAQEHRAELAGADQCDPNRPRGDGTLAEQLVDVHGALRPLLRKGRARSGSRPQAARSAGNRGARPTPGA